MSGAEKSTDEQVRLRAYTLWQQDGQPEGRSEEYWERARLEIEGSEAADLETTIKPAQT